MFLGQGLFPSGSVIRQHEAKLREATLDVHIHLGSQGRWVLDNKICRALRSKPTFFCREQTGQVMLRWEGEGMGEGTEGQGRSWSLGEQWGNGPKGGRVREETEKRAFVTSARSQLLKVRVLVVSLLPHLVLVPWGQFGCENRRAVILPVCLLTVEFVSE